jgi:hypothetical protein
MESDSATAAEAAGAGVLLYAEAEAARQADFSELAKSGEEADTAAANGDGAALP